MATVALCRNISVFLSDPSPMPCHLFIWPANLKLFGKKKVLRFDDKKNAIFLLKNQDFSQDPMAKSNARKNNAIDNRYDACSDWLATVKADSIGEYDRFSNRSCFQTVLRWHVANDAALWHQQ